MTELTLRLIWAIGFVILAPFLGGFLEGLDRKISARMQRRIGPPVIQPFYDVRKLMNKQYIIVNRGQNLLILSYMILMILTGAMLFGGTDLLLCFFVLATAATFMYFTAVLTGSPYGTMAGSRELVQMMAYEPAVLLTCIGFYLACGSFRVLDIVNSDTMLITKLPGFFVAYVFILTIKMRKSPFDSSASHHPHQELVQGIKTELGAKNLAIFIVTEWYENIFLLSIVGLFFLTKNPLSIIVALVAMFVVYFLEILIDNSSARVKWTLMLKMTWIVTLVFAGVNLLILMLLK